MDVAINFLKVCWPILSSVLLFILIFFIPKTDKQFELGISRFGFSVPISVNATLGKRVLLAIFAIASLCSMFLRDYSSFFTGDVVYDVYYDVEGIEQCIFKIEDESLDELIHEDWKRLRLEFYADLDSTIQKAIPQSESFFSYQNIEDYLFSIGRGTHKVSYFSFWQKYKIDHVEGYVEYELHPPESEIIEFETRYFLRNKKDNIVSPSFKEFISGEIVTKSTMAHSMLIHSKEYYQAEIIGLTKAKIFPISKFEFSLFCFEDPEKKLIPYGYAYYPGQ